MYFRCGVGASGAGYEIDVTTTSVELYGRPVTLSQSGTTLQTRLFDNTGTAVFFVKDPGTYTVSVTYDGRTYTQNVTVTKFNAALTTWNATINISTTSPELYEQQIVVTDSNSSVVGSTYFDNAGAASFTVHDTDTYTFTVTYSGYDYAESITISAEGVYSLTIVTIPDGTTVTPVNDIQTWLKCAGIRDKNYTTIGQVLADTTTLLALISDQNAVNYMVRSTSWASSVCVNQTAMTYIGANNYCAETLLGNSTWCTAICNSTYFDRVLTTKVPTMTSNTTPSGQVIYNSYFNDTYYPFYAFDGNDSTYWAQDSEATIGYIGYVFPSAVKIYKCLANPGNQGRTVTARFKRSVDNSTWVNISDDFSYVPGGGAIIINAKNIASSRYYKFEGNTGSTLNTCTLQFYGR